MIGTMTRHCHRPRTRALRMAGLAALAVTLLAGMDQAHAAFTATTTNANTFAAAASFPTYPTSVTGDSPWAYHRSDDGAALRLLTLDAPRGARSAPCPHSR